MKDFLEGPMSVDAIVDAMDRSHEPKKIINGIYVGDSHAYESVRGRSDWSYSLAAQTFHREHLGYTGRGAPKDSPHYLWHEDGHTLRLNLVDADNVKYIDDRVIEKALVWCLGEYGQHRTLIVACDKGQSRSPTLAIMLRRRLGHYPNWTHLDAMNEMNERLQGNYFPGRAMREYLQVWWERERLDEVIEGDD